MPDPATLRRLRRVLAHACPPGADPLDWRRLREAFAEPAPPAPSMFPPEGWADMSGPSREERWPAPVDLDTLF